VQRLDHIVTGFLDRARPPELQPRPGDLDALLDSMLPLLREGTRAGIDIELEKGGARMVSFDPMAMRQVILNLVRNAVEAVGQRGHVRIVTHQGPQAVEMAVEDNGPGIPIDQRDRIFDFGFTTKPAGYGIGMSLVQRLVTEMHGSVAIAASATGGALVRITLPSAREASGERRQQT
jgi:signal transduction histidine kinase